MEFPCPNDGCGKVFNNRMTRHRHLSQKKCHGKPVENSMDTDFEKVENHFVCKACKKTIAQRNNLKRHREVCKGEKDEEFVSIAMSPSNLNLG